MWFRYLTFATSCQVLGLCLGLSWGTGEILAQESPWRGAVLGSGDPPAWASQAEASGDRNWSLLPFVIYSPETSISLGALYARVLPDSGTSERVLSSLMVNAQYTLKNQLSAGFQYEGRPSANRLTVANGSVNLSWPDRLYAPGNRSGRESYEEWTGQGLELLGSFFRSWIDPRFFLGPKVSLRFVRIAKQEAGGLLGRMAVEGAQDHGLLGAGAGAVWDSRDSPIYPRTGSFHSLSFLGYRSFRGDVRWVGSVEGDFRAYRSLREGTVLAARGRVRSAWGDVPFTMHAAIGGIGGGLRGIYETRYAHRTGVVAVAELRQTLFWRIGGVLFGAVGRVAPGPFHLSVKGVHGAAGGGLRFALMPEAGLNVGVDFAMGEGEGGLYFLLGEVF